MNIMLCITISPKIYFMKRKSSKLAKNLGVCMIFGFSWSVALRAFIAEKVR